MQSLAAYTFEAEVDNTEGRLEAMDVLIDEWLAKKGAPEPRAKDGSFVSKSGDGVGQFSRLIVRSGAGILHEVELIETAHTGAIFTTMLQIAANASKVVLYATLSAAPGESRVTPVGLYPRCPRIIRSIIERFPDWKFCDQEVPLSKAFDARADHDAQNLCKALRSKSRRLPIVVVSDDQDESVWPDLHTRIAENLVGLSDVAVVSAESSWVLTDELGPRDSCYLGAVRLYWPGMRADESLPGITWKSSRLASFGFDDAGRNKFLAVLRKEIMSVAALTMAPPYMCRAIKNAAEKERIQALELGARDKALDSIIEENSRLLEKLHEAEQTIQSLQWKLAAASYAQKSAEAESVEIAKDDGAADDSEHVPPQQGETRFYKKIGSGGGVDALVQTKACQHKESSWRPAFKGDQAEKGIQKLEGRNDWKSIAHCGACTGGGRWRVRW